MTIFRSFEGLRAGDIAPDLLAGLMLAAIAIPEQMATAKLGEFPPTTGFVAFVAATIAFATLGASRVISVGADSTITPIFAAGLALVTQSGSHAYISLAATLAVLVGILLLAAGFLRLGWIANLLSVPVTTGFLAGIAVHIAVSQLPTALGLHSGRGEILHQLATTIAAVRHTNLFALAIAVAVFMGTLLAERLSPRIPGALLGLILSAGAAYAFNLDATGVEMIGRLAAGPFFVGVSVPGFPDLVRLVPLAFILSLVIMVQSAATARSFPTGTNSSDFDRDLVGVGAANLLAALAGAFPVNASPPRTAIAAESGVRSQLCGVVAAAIVIVLIVFGSGLLSRVPSAALAGVLFYVSWRITRVGTMLAVLRQSRGEFGLIATTVLAIVILPTEIGVGLGIIFSLLHGMWTVTRTRLIELENVTGTTVWWPPGNNAGSTKKIEGTRVVAFQAPLSFLNAQQFRDDFDKLLAKGNTRLVVLEAGSVVEIDYTAAGALKEVIVKCREGGAAFALARLESVRAGQALERFGVMAALGSNCVFRSVDDAIRAFASLTSPDALQ